MRPYLVISCPATSRSGYGDHARDLIRSLIAMDKFEINILDQIWGMCPRTGLEPADPMNRYILKGAMKKQPDIWIQLTVPNEFQPIGKYNIGITAGIETDLCSVDWVNGCNRMNKIIVPSEHSKYVLKKTSWEEREKGTDRVINKLQVNKDIDVLFEGLDLDIFKKTKDIPSTIKNPIDNIKNDFCYLMVGHWLHGDLGQDRKDLGMTIKTFLEAFKNKSPKNMPALIIKTSSATFSLSDREDMINRIKTIKSSINSKNLPEVHLLHGDLTPEEMNGLYNHPKVKAMISFTKGEGFGRPLLEFSNTGKPTIVSNWSGHIDFMSAYGIMLPGEIKQVHESAVWENVILKESKWFTVNYEYAANIILDVNKNYKKYHEKSRKQTQYIKENFSLNSMTEKFDKIMSEISEGFTDNIKLDAGLGKLEEVVTHE